MQFGGTSTTGHQFHLMTYPLSYIMHNPSRLLLLTCARLDTMQFLDMFLVYSKGYTK